MKFLAILILILASTPSTRSFATSSESSSPPELIVSPVPTTTVVESEPMVGEIESKDLLTRVPNKRARTWMLSFGPGIIYTESVDSKATGNGSLGFSSHFGGVTQLTSDSPVFVGVDMALQFWNYSEVRNENTATGLQVLPTAYYNFDWDLISAFQPYLGLSAGPHVLFSQRDSANSGTTVRFEWLVRPGLTFLMAPGLSVIFEPKFGFLGEQFAFNPQIAANLFL